MKSKSLRISLCAMVTALSTLIMMITGIITIGTYALPAIAGIFMISIVVEIDKKWAIATYISTSLLSMILAADKEAVILFVLFFGYYPILKAWIEKIKNKFILYLLKLLIFNSSVIIAYLIVIKFLQISYDAFVIFGVSVPILFLAMGNVIFLLYDYTLLLLTRLYILRLHPKIKNIIKQNGVH